MEQHRIFTDPLIRSLKAQAKPYKLAEYAPRGEGRLIVRVLPNGSKEFFYRYRVNGGDSTVALGRYDHKGKEGKTLAQLRASASKKRSLQRDTGDVKGHEQAEKRRKDLAARQGSFRQLLEGYVQALRDEKKPSAQQVGTIFARHVIKPFPVLASAKANEIESADIQRILGKMVRTGLTRQVNKTRSYIRAAFAYGSKADLDPRTAAREGVLFGLKYNNPASLVPRIKEYDKAGDRILNDDELRDYWNGLEKLPLVQRCTLRFNLALACQRVTQLLRADWPSFDWQFTTEHYQGPALSLKDSKGRGGKVREHIIPLTAFALEQLKPLREMEKETPSPFTTDGKRHLNIQTLSNCVAEIANGQNYGLKDLRRTAETTLQRLGVSKEVRAHLLSHGRTGVQAVHYERWSYLPEKKQALEKWTEHLQRIFNPEYRAKVVNLR